jgi:protease-4
MVRAADAHQRGLVDALVDVDGLRDLLARKLDGEINLIRDYGLDADEPIDFSNIFTLFASLTRKPPPQEGPAIALIHAQGMIVDGESGTGLFGGASVGSATMREAFRIARRDDRVKAVVLRIDSPGGSALASEAMWQAARRLAAEKPLVVSIGSMAASGGYYLASAGDHIIAEESSIIGSIGVVGGKFVLGGLYEKLGLTTETFSRGDNADLFSSQRPFTDQQRRMVTRWMRSTYEQFIERVMSTRKEKIRNIDQVARGRVFLAGEALELGMIDALGGLSAAMDHAAEQAELDEYDVRVLPEPKTLADLLTGSRPRAAGAIPRAALTPTVDPMILGLPRSMRALLEQQVHLMRGLERRPVMLLSPFVVTVR